MKGLTSRLLYTMTNFEFKMAATKIGFLVVGVVLNC